jgi:hypothetical protein
METRGPDRVNVTDFEVLFSAVQEAKHAEVVRASEEIAKLSEPIQALVEATAEIAKPRFTTFTST